MSHNIAVKNTVIKSISALESAVAALRRDGVNISLERNAHYRGYSASTSGTRDIVLKLPDSPYDVALVRNQDGTYTIEVDAWNGHVQRQIGTVSDAVSVAQAQQSMQKEQLAVGRLLQEYTAAALTEAAAAQGLCVQGVFDTKTKQTRLVVSSF